jgi:chitin synthase
VQGEVRSKKHGDDKTAVYDGTSIPLRRWEDWERSRLRKLRRDAKRRAKMEQQQANAQWNGDGYGGARYEDDEYGDYLREPQRLEEPGGSGSDSGSIFSDEDVWGADIGGVSSGSRWTRTRVGSLTLLGPVC